MDNTPSRSSSDSNDLFRASLPDFSRSLDLEHPDTRKAVTKLNKALNGLLRIVLPGFEHVNFDSKLGTIHFYDIPKIPYSFTTVPSIDVNLMFRIGDKLREGGESMATRISSILASESSEWTWVDGKILALILRLANDIHIFQSYFNTNWPGGNPAGEGHLPENVPFYLLNFRLRQLKLYIQSDVIGDRYAVDREARRSGLAREVMEIMDNYDVVLQEILERLESNKREVRYLIMEIMKRPDYQDFPDQKSAGTHYLPQYIEDLARQLSIDTRPVIEEMMERVTCETDKKDSLCRRCMRRLKFEDAWRTSCGHIIHARCLDSGLACYRKDKELECVSCHKHLQVITSHDSETFQSLLNKLKYHEKCVSDLSDEDRMHKEYQNTFDVILSQLLVDHEARPDTTF